MHALRAFASVFARATGTVATLACDLQLEECQQHRHLINKLYTTEITTSESEVLLDNVSVFVESILQSVPGVHVGVRNERLLKPVY